SINGAHIISTKADGMIAVGAMDHEIVSSDLARIEEVATLGKVPANREILEVVPHSYRLDGQDNIKDPLGMTGTRLEINANVVSALSPHLHNLEKSASMAKVEPHLITPAVLAASRAVLAEQQKENGVAVIDLGGATTSIAIFEEGDLQWVSVIPVGGVNITNDLAIGLKTDPEIAEKVKVGHAVVFGRKNDERISLKQDKEQFYFDAHEVDEIAEARLDEIFEAIQKELKKAGKAGQLPSGVILTGGTSKIKGMAEYAKDKLGLAVRVGKAGGFGGVIEGIEDPQFATAIGLMLLDAEGAGEKPSTHRSGENSKAALKKAGGFLSSFLNRFKA
ncbi:MAG TPA: cell division protein FtsA, partial [Candidatus Saccharimonadales bacterium]|nr:cell division protein FtsA [Candidatus Saccharimonadales bacterium]